MFRYLVPSCIFFALGFYTSQYDLFKQVTDNIKELVEDNSLVYKNGTTSRGTTCLIVRPEDDPQKLLKVSEERRIYDDFTSNQMSIENGTSNSSQIYCYDYLDTEEYKLVSAEKFETSSFCYQEVSEFEERDYWKYESLTFDYQIERDCCGNGEYVSCTMTNRRNRFTVFLYIKLVLPFKNVILHFVVLSIVASVVLERQLPQQRRG